MADLAVLVPLGTAVLAALGAGVRAVWGAIQRSRLDYYEAKAELVVALHAAQDELKAERAEHWKTAMALERLLGKLEREQGSGSPPPPR